MAKTVWNNEGITNIKISTEVLQWVLMRKLSLYYTPGKPILIWWPQLNIHVVLSVNSKVLWKDREKNYLFIWNQIKEYFTTAQNCQFQHNEVTKQNHK